jgi:hypothetical protein
VTLRTSLARLSFTGHCNSSISLDRVDSMIACCRVGGTCVHF